MKSLGENKGGEKSEKKGIAKGSTYMYLEVLFLGIKRGVLEKEDIDLELED
jgi:hypothetical protein